jgi:uncharacterized protein YegP (UPF0339 family)
MATAPKKPRAGKQVGRLPRERPALASLEFRVHQDNGGDFHWSIIGERGGILAQSEGFGSYEDAERAARCVREGAGSARVQPHVADERLLAVV